MAKDLSYSVLLDFYGDILTEKQRELMDYYYNADLSLSEISENEGITRQGVHDAIRRSEQVLQEMEEKLALVSRFGKIKDLAKQIEEYALLIQEENRQFCYSSQIGLRMDQILLLTDEIQQGE